MPISLVKMPSAVHVVVSCDGDVNRCEDIGGCHAIRYIVTYTPPCLKPRVGRLARPAGRTMRNVIAFVLE